jgi:hypothetical protein
MILVYRPELESPPMDKECSLGFSFIAGTGVTDHIQLTSGVNRGFPDATWDKIKDYDVVKGLLKLGALRIEEEASDITEDAKISPSAADTVADLPITQALNLIEDSFDVAQLQRWDAKEARIRVKNAIAKRISAITEGNG